MVHESCSRISPPLQQSSSLRATHAMDSVPQIAYFQGCSYLAEFLRLRRHGLYILRDRFLDPIACPTYLRSAVDSYPTQKPTRRYIHHHLPPNIVALHLPIPPFPLPLLSHTTLLMQNPHAHFPQTRAQEPRFLERCMRWDRDPLGVVRWWHAL